MRFLAAMSVLAIFGCDRSAELSAGRGLIDNGGSLAVDTARVPTIEGCSEGQPIAMRSGRLGCDPAADTLDRVDMDTKQARRVQEIETFQRRVLDIEQLHTPTYSWAATACSVGTTALSVGHVEQRGPWVRSRMQTNDGLSLYCPVPALAARTTWNTFEVVVEDPDGRGTNSAVSAKLSYLREGQPGRIAEIVRNGSDDTGPSARAVTFDEPWDFERRTYFIEVQLFRTADGLPPGFASVRLMER